MTIGERIKISRKNKGLQLADLADAVGVSRQTIFKYEKNIISNIPIDKIEKIAKVLDVTPTYLSGWQVNQYLDDDGCLITENKATFSVSVEELDESVNSRKKVNKMIDQFYTLDSFGQDLVMTVIEKEHERCTYVVDTKKDLE